MLYIVIGLLLGYAFVFFCGMKYKEVVIREKEELKANAEKFIHNKL